MFEYYIWLLAFIFLYISIFWIIIFSLKEKKYEESNIFPEVTIIIPAYNEEKGIRKTLESIFNLDYPKDKLKIIVIDDCSSDKTVEIVKEFKNVKLVNRNERGGNAAIALNTGLNYVNTELFARVDADSYIERDSLKKLVKYFSDERIGSVISSILVDEPKNSLEKLQKFEYIITNFTRKLMAKIGTLHITNGVLSVYRTDIIKNIGGFDEKNLTEDYEIALRLRKNGYDIIMETDSRTYTHVPNTLNGFWRQRVRWYRGFISNNLKYKDILFNKKFGGLGWFQMPLGVLSMFLVLISFVLFFYQFINSVYDFLYKIVILKWEAFGLSEIPNLIDFLLGLDIRLYGPVILSLIFAIYIYYLAHTYYNERKIYPLVTIIYLFFYPIITGIQWAFAFIFETFKFEKKW